MSKQKHAVVTGGSGFVGSRLVDRLLETGFNVITSILLRRTGVEFSDT